MNYMGRHSAEPKLNLVKVFIVLIITVAIIVGIVYAMTKKNDKDENVNNNEIKNEIIEIPAAEETPSEETSQTPEVESNSQENVQTEIQDPKQQEAIEKAKEFREKESVGIENVNYEIDSVSEDGETITVIVRDPETTKIIMFYDVNTKTGEVVEH